MFSLYHLQAGKGLKKKEQKRKNFCQIQPHFACSYSQSSHFIFSHYEISQAKIILCSKLFWVACQRQVEQREWRCLRLRKILPGGANLVLQKSSILTIPMHFQSIIAIIEELWHFRFYPKSANCNFPVFQDTYVCLDFPEALLCG